MALQQQVIVEVLETEEADVLVQRVVNTVVVAGCQQGPPGPSGLSGNTTDLLFNFGDATPSPIGVISGSIVSASIVITTAFNGVNPSLSIGSFSNPVLIMTTAENDPTVSGRYEANPAIVVNEQLFLYITPGAGPTQGAGAVYIEIAA